MGGRGGGAGGGLRGGVGRLSVQGARPISGEWGGDGGCGRFGKGKVGGGKWEGWMCAVEGDGLFVWGSLGGWGFFLQCIFLFPSPSIQILLPSVPHFSPSLSVSQLSF